MSRKTRETGAGSAQRSPWRQESAGGNGPRLPADRAFSVRHEPTRRSRRPHEPAIEGRERKIECLGNRHVPGVVARDRVAQFPDAGGERLEREQTDVEADEVALRGSGFQTRQLSRSLEPTKDV